MEKKNLTTGTVIMALGVVLGLSILGLTLKAGIDNFTNKDRRVTVKGLSVEEVDADIATWPISIKETGNDLSQLYAKNNQTTAAIKNFLVSNGIDEADISIGAPQVTDLDADIYSENKHSYRYLITSTTTVYSKNIQKVRELVNRQGELLEDGIIVENGYINYELTSFSDMKPRMMAEAIKNAEKTAQQFAENSKSKLNKIESADQGQFSIEDRDDNTPYIKQVRVVTTITYSLKD